jgi:hypothetical protein
MDVELEWGIRRKIVDLQVFLTSSDCTNSDLSEIDKKLEHVLEVVNRSKARGSACEA